jgi:hypothetical protein
MVAVSALKPLVTATGVEAFLLVTATPTPVAVPVLAMNGEPAETGLNDQTGVTVYAKALP